MASDAQRTIELVFQGTDKTAAAVQSAIKNTREFSSSIESATQPIADFTTNALKIEAALLSAGAAIGAFSIKLASDFQTSLTDLQKVLSDTDNIEQYRDLAFELSEAYGVSSNDVLAAIANYKQAGFTAEEAATLTKSGLDLVIAGNIEAARSSDLLVASIKGFGAEAADSTQIVDLLNAVSNNYAATVEQLLEGFSTLSPIASAAGFSLQETIAVLTPGIEVFQSGSEVANALRKAFTDLVSDNKRVVETLAALGVAQRDANGELRSARDIYFDVAVALQNADENQRVYLASQLVGSQRSAQFLAVTDGLSKSLTIAGDSFEFVGSAAKEVAAQLSTAENAGNRAVQTFKNLLINLGTPLLDEYSGIADAISAIFKALGDSLASGDGGISDLVAFAESQFGRLQESLETVARNLPAALEIADFSGFIDGLKAISGAFDLLFEGVDLSTAEGLASVITSIGFAFEGLSQFSAGVIESFKPLFDAITNVAGGLLDLDSGLFKTAGEFAGFVTQANLLAGGINSLLPSIEALLNILVIRQGIGLVGGLANAATAAGGLAGALSSAGLIGAAGAAGAAIGTLANKATELATGTSLSTRLVDWAISMGFLDDAATDVVQGLNSSSEAIQDTGLSADAAAASIAAADAEMQNIVNSTGFALDAVGDFGDEIYGVKDGVGTLYDLSGALAQIPETTDEATQSVQAFQAATEQITLEEKLALIEAQTAITVATIEADARKVVAAFESINTTIESTGTSITSLFGLLGDDSISKLDKLDISDQIEIENERREEALKLQEKLLKAQIAEVNARTAAFRRGNAAITVNGDGLQPHLEAFMFEILSAIQVQVNAQGYELLLGAGA